MKKYCQGNMESAYELSKIDKEKVQDKNETIDYTKISNVQCGLKNPCVFGKHNPEFNKNI